MLDTSLISPKLGNHFIALSPDGEWLADLASSINTSWPPNRVELINMVDGSPEALTVIRVGEAFLPPVWSTNLDQPSLVTLAGPVDGTSRLPVPTRLMVASPDEPGLPIVVAEAAPNERFASPVFCADGALLYLSEHNGEYRLVRQVPGDQAETWLMFDQLFQPFACP